MYNIPYGNTTDYICIIYIIYYCMRIIIYVYKTQRDHNAK